MARTQTKPSLLGDSVTRGLREGALWIFGILALILLAALVTYDPSDPGFSFSGERGKVANYIGPLGAWLSDFFFLLFGAPSFLFPVMLAYAGWMLFRTQTGQEPLTRTMFLFRTLGFILTLVTSAGLASMYFDPASWPHTAGGILGDAVWMALSKPLSVLGATLLLLAFWLAGITLFLEVSWIGIMDAVGRGTLRTLEGIRDRIVTMNESFQVRRVKQVRHEVLREEKQKVSRRKPPRIESVPPSVERSERSERERQVLLFDPPAAHELPPLSLLDDPPEQKAGYSDEALEAMSRLVELKLRDFGVTVEVVAVYPGPVVTRFELRPAPGVKGSQIGNLSKDLARALSAISVRVVDVIPGKSVVGLEIPNESRELVSLGEILKSKSYDQSSSPLTLALGKDISGHSIVADLTRMPHLLIAGTTGSGKSVALNAMVLSLLYKSTAEHVRLIMIDPKMLELSVYEGIPHLLAPVVTDMKEAANSLRWCVAEMERRYRLMAALGVRNISGLNRKISDAKQTGEPILDPLFEPPQDVFDEDVPLEEAPELQPLPFVVVFIDELADMMLIVGKKVEELITRLAQKARASGIHLIIATQRPSVDVITGLIKANIPTRIAFQVSARVDSRTILDQIGAENLLGHGDMLYLPPGTSVPTRVHGAFVSDREVHTVVAHLKGGEAPTYIEEILTGPSGQIPGLTPEKGESTDAEQDPLYDQAVRIVTETRKASISGVQRRLKIGYNRAARMVEAMEDAGIVGPLESNGQREILVPPPPKD